MPPRSASRVRNARARPDEAPEPVARTLASVPERSPGRGEELAVPGVPAIRLDEQGRPSEVAPRPARPRSAGAAHRGARSTRHRVVQSGRDLVGGEPTGGRAKDQMHDRRRAHADEQAGRHADREGRPERDTRQSPERHHPPSDEPERPPHVRRRHHDDASPWPASSPGRRAAARSPTTSGSLTSRCRQPSPRAGRTPGQRPGGSSVQNKRFRPRATSARMSRMRAQAIIRS